MFGTNKDHCWTCGKDFLTGCVLTGECQDCERHRLILESAGWTKAQEGFFGIEERQWNDPKFPGTVYGEQAALKIQEGRDIETMQRASE